MNPDIRAALKRIMDKHGPTGFYWRKEILLDALAEAVERVIDLLDDGQFTKQEYLIRAVARAIDPQTENKP